MRSANNNRSRKSELVFVGLCGPELVMADAVKKDARPQVAAQRVQMSLLKGLDLAKPGRVSLVSSLPLGDFPSFPQIIVYGGEWSRNGESQDFLCGFINLTLIKHITRFITVFIALVKKALSCARRGVNLDVILYSLNSAQLMATVLCAKIFRSSRLFIIIPDLPQYMASQDKRPIWKRVLKWFDKELIYRAVKKADGLIVFADAIGEEIAPLLPKMIMEGVVAATAVETVSSHTESVESRPAIDTVTVQPLKLAYAGSLGQGYGVELLIECLTTMRDLPVEVHVYGKGPLESMCIAADANLEKFHYHGFVAPELVSSRLRGMDVLVNLREPNAPISRYAFPSKILEYMATGIPVLTTRIPSLPDEYLQFMFVMDSYCCADFKEIIADIYRLRSACLKSMGSGARKFVLENKSGLVQAGRITRFIDSVR